jgi:hypothetical protein
LEFPKQLVCIHCTCADIYLLLPGKKQLEVIIAGVCPSVEMSTTRSDLISAAQLVGMSCVVVLSVFWGWSDRGALWRQDRGPDKDLRLDFGEAAAGLLASSTAITATQTGEFGNQVAGHVKQPIRTLAGSVLKPLNRRLHFLRELHFYHQIAHEFGSHCSHSARQFVPRLTGWYRCKSDQTPSSLKAEEEKEKEKSARKKSCASKKARAAPEGVVLDKHGSPVAAAQDTLDAFLLTHQVYLGLEDLTAAHSKPCAIDIKMGSQTFEPSADASKKRREVSKCPHQTEVGFRITGFQVFDARSDQLGTVSKLFGRRLQPHAVFEALALFFFDGVQLRRDVLLATIQELEKLLLWFRSQNQAHFYCSSLLITYDAWRGSEYGEQHYRQGSPHFLQRLGPQFPSPHPELPDEQAADADDGVASGGVLLEEEPELRPPPSRPATAPPRVKLQLPGSLHEPPGRRAGTRQKPPPPSGGVQVKMIDFAHALPGQSSLDHGYIHGLRSLITRLHAVLRDPDVTKRLLVDRAKYDTQAAGVRSARGE